MKHRIMILVLGLTASASFAQNLNPAQKESDFRYLASHGMMGTDFDSCCHNWATQGLNYYVVARLHWNPEQRVDAIIDRTNTVGTVWLGTTIGCAQCHNHKNDPIPQEEYYRFLAYFNNDVNDSRRIDAPRSKSPATNNGMRAARCITAGSRSTTMSRRAAISA